MIFLIHWKTHEVSTKGPLTLIIIVNFKRLGSRHIHKEIEIPYCVFGFNEIICKTGLNIFRHLHTSATSSRKNTLKQYEVTLCIFVVYIISQNACIERAWPPFMQWHRFWRRVYSDRTRQRQNDGVKHNALDLEHLLVNRCIQTGRVASKKLNNRDAVVLTLARSVWIDPYTYKSVHFK